MGILDLIVKEYKLNPDKARWCIKSNVLRNSKKGYSVFKDKKGLVVEHDDLVLMIKK